MATRDTDMGFAGSGAASPASSNSSNAGDDLLHDDGVDEVEDEVNRMEEDDRPRALAPTSSSYLASPGRSTSSSSNPFTSSSKRQLSSRQSSTRARLTRAAADVGGSFERERAAIGRRGGGGPRGMGGEEGEEGNGRSQEEGVLSKVVDKEYKGRLTFDPFWAQLQAASKKAAAATSSATIANATPVAPAAAGPSSATLPPPVPTD
ncbi:hypothetical protein JCM8547_000941 [Rhodosporidiobolus lusitaniae]